MLSRVAGLDLIRLQCFEGLDSGQALYEWDYPKQLLQVRVAESRGQDVGDLYREEFLLRRPLLRAVRAEQGAVLLIDEIDRADSEFEAFLLEFLGDFQITIPELGTIRARTPPIVVLTSNRTRELHDALKRRCLYHWIAFPEPDRERAILRAAVPGLEERAAEGLVRAVQRVRRLPLLKRPGIAESVEWARGAMALAEGGSPWPVALRRALGLLDQGRGGHPAAPRARGGAVRRCLTSCCSRPCGGRPAMPEPVVLAADHLWGFLAALRGAGVPTAPTKRADLLRRSPSLAAA